MERKELAVKFKHSGYNCAQAVLCAFADDVGMDQKTMFRVGEGLGLGMGCMDGTCGALNAACVLAGITKSTVDRERASSKGATYRFTREMVKRFREKAGATACADLKGRDTGVVMMACPDCVKTACELAEDVLGLK